jgi:hypothetical protein
MGRRRKPVTEPELPDTDADLQQPKSTRQVVEAEHTIRFRKPLDVGTLEPEPAEEQEEIEEFEDLHIEDPDEGQSRRRPALTFRSKLKKELGDRGIGGDEQLKLRIDRLPYYEANGNTGINAEKEFVRNIPCSKEFVLNDEYLDEVSKSCGPGAYWFTLRHKNTIVKMWHMKISGPPPIAPVTAEAGQGGPQVVYQPAPNQQQQPVAVQDPLAQMRQAFKLVRELRDDLGLMMPQPSPPPAPPPPTDPKVAALQLIAENPDVMEKIGSGIAKTVLGSKGGDDSNPWAEVAKEAIKSGQAPQIVATLIREFMAPLRNLWGNNNGQAQMAPPPVQNQTQPGHSQQDQLAPGQEMGQAADPGRAPGGVAEDVHQHGAPQDALEPADQLIYLLIAAMERQATMPEAKNIINVAIFRAPELRASIDELINLPTDQILALVTAYHPPVAEMAHAREWLESLIAALTVPQEGADE